LRRAPLILLRNSNWRGVKASPVGWDGVGGFGSPFSPVPVLLTCSALLSIAVTLLFSADTTLALQRSMRICSRFGINRSLLNDGVEDFPFFEEEPMRSFSLLRVRQHRSGVLKIDGDSWSTETTLDIFRGGVLISPWILEFLVDFGVVGGRGRGRDP